MEIEAGLRIDKHTPEKDKEVIQAKMIAKKYQDEANYFRDVILSMKARGTIVNLITRELHEYKDVNIAVSAEDYQSLKDDIQKNGIRQPLMVWKRKVICGNTRLKIAQELKLVEVPCLMMPEDMSDLDIKEYAITDNLSRRHFTTAQKVELALQLEKVLTEKAKERKAEAGKNNLEKFKDSLVSTESDLTKKNPLETNSLLLGGDEKTEKEEKGKALEIAAKKAGVGYETAYKGKTIKAENPELYKKVQSGDISINEAHKIVKPRPISTDQMIKQAQKQIDRANYKNAPKDLPKFNLNDTQIFFALAFKSIDTLIEQLKFGAVNDAGKEYLCKAIEAMSEKVDTLASCLTYPYKVEAKPVEEAWQCQGCMVPSAGRKLCEVVRPCPKTAIEAVTEQEAVEEVAA